MLLNEDKFVLNEQKTNKRRVIKINADFQKHIQQCCDALKIVDMDEACFLSKKNMVMTTQRINVRLKEIKKKYNVKIDNFSCHSLRKAFGRKVFESSGEKCTDGTSEIVRIIQSFISSNHKNLSWIEARGTT